MSLLGASIVNYGLTLAYFLRVIAYLSGGLRVLSIIEIVIHFIKSLAVITLLAWHVYMIIKGTTTYMFLVEKDQRNQWSKDLSEGKLTLNEYEEKLASLVKKKTKVKQSTVITQGLNSGAASPRTEAQIAPIGRSKIVPGEFIGNITD
jgi:hypothetical protein